MIEIEVVYALPDRQWRRTLQVVEGCTLKDAVERSGLLTEFPEIDLGGRNKTGIWNKLATLDAPLRERDRVEVYRPLIADAKEVRRKRAAAGKVMKKGGGDLPA